MDNVSHWHLITLWTLFKLKCELYVGQCMRLKFNYTMAMDNLSSWNLIVVWTLYHEIATLIALCKNGQIKDCFVKSWKSNQNWKLCCSLGCNLLFHITSAPSSSDYFESKFNGGGMNVLSRMKAWHMTVLRLDKTLTIFWFVLWICLFYYFRCYNYSMKVHSCSLFDGLQSPIV
jgi:hypothetical protein